MNRFSIKDVENLSGIKAHTLRIWELRYSFMVPKRKESNHRFYDDEDLKQMLRIAYLYNKGCKISALASLSKNELVTKLREEARQNAEPGIFINRMIEAAIDFDAPAFESILEEAISKLGFEKCMLETVYPYLYKIGFLWLSDSAFPSQEHFSSNIIIKKLCVSIDALPLLPATGLRYLLFTPEKECHEIPLLFMYYLLKKSGHRVAYLGTSVSLAIIESCCQPLGITHLYAHLIVQLNSPKRTEIMQQLLQQFPQLKIVLSGPATQGLHTHKNVRLLRSLDEQVTYGLRLAPFD